MNSSKNELDDQASAESQIDSHSQALSASIDERKPKKWLPVAVLAAVAIASGVFVRSQIDGQAAGGRYNTQDAVQADDQQAQYDQHAFKALQSQLKNSTLFPDDFKKVPPFSLVHGNNQPLTESMLEGKWSVLFFGFTNCPDVCPITLNEMNGVVAQLQADNETVPQVLFITVDPVRDPVEKMAEYVAYFNEDFIGGSGDLTDITALTTKLGIVASYTANKDGSDDYTVDHTASMLLVDPTLKVRAKLNPPHTMDTLTADLKTLISYYN